MKLGNMVGLLNIRYSFPGLLGRGLIEVDSRDSTARGCSAAFPGLLGRGLIEVTRPESIDAPATPLPRSTGPGPH